MNLGADDGSLAHRPPLSAFRPLVQEMAAPRAQVAPGVVPVRSVSRNSNPRLRDAAVAAQVSARDRLLGAARHLPAIREQWLDPRFITAGADVRADTAASGTS